MTEDNREEARADELAPAGEAADKETDEELPISKEFLDNMPAE